MAFKFSIGQAVEYKPIGAEVGYFTVVRQMPEEIQAPDRKYRIKSVQEGFERNVLECTLSPATVPQESYGAMWPVRRSSSRE
jgi:hypothetical protein